MFHKIVKSFWATNKTCLKQIQLNPLSLYVTDFHDPLLCNLYSYCFVVIYYYFPAYRRPKLITLIIKKCGSEIENYY